MLDAASSPRRGDARGPPSSRRRTARRPARGSSPRSPRPIDLDEVLARTLEAAAALRGVDAAMVVAPPDGASTPIVATFGLTAEEAAAQPVASSPSDGATRRGRASRYRYEPERRGAAADLIRGGVAVPLARDTSGRSGRSPSSGAAPSASPTEERGRGARGRSPGRAARRSRTRGVPGGAAAGRPRRAHRPPQPPLLPRDARSARSPGPTATSAALALVVFDIDDFKAINDRDRPSRRRRRARRGRPSACAARVRGADIACRVGGDEFAVILPEVGARGRRELYRRLQFAVGSRRRRARPSGPPLRRDRGARARGRRGRALRARRRRPLPGEGAAARARCSRPRARRAAGRSASPASGTSSMSSRAGSRARRALATCSRRRTSVRTSSRKRAQSDSELAREEMPGRGRRRLLVGRRALAFTGTSHVPPHFAVDTVDNSSADALARLVRAPSAPRRGPVYASPPHRRSPFRGMPHEVLAKSAKIGGPPTRGRLPARGPRTRPRARARRLSGPRRSCPTSSGSDPPQVARTAARRARREARAT